eukprot:scaffold171563_cov31-Tisochrysis_lutea.AAC.2
MPRPRQIAATSTDHNGPRGHAPWPRLHRSPSAFIQPPICLSPLLTDRFADDLSEFDESRETLQALIEEYRASESPDYVNWGLERVPGEPDRGGFLERKPGEVELYEQKHAY